MNVLDDEENRRELVSSSVWNPNDPNDSTLFIQKYGRRHFETLSFIHPETLPEVIEEANRMFVRHMRQNEEFAACLKELGDDWREKKAVVPESDGSHESELRARLARRISDEASVKFEAEEKRQKEIVKTRTTVEGLVVEYIVEDRSRAMDEGELIFSEVRGDRKNPEVHKTYRLADDRYMLFVFNTGSDPNPMQVGPEDVRFHTKCPGSLSLGALEAVIADKERREQAVVQV